MIVEWSYAPSIEALELSSEAYRQLLASPFADERVAECAAIVVANATDLPSPGRLPVVVIAIGDGFGAHGPAGADVVISEDDVDDVMSMITAAPVAARSLVVLLRSMPDVGVEAGLAAESSVYSMLQAAGEFAAWRAANPPQHSDDGRPTVATSRDGDVLTIALDRPHRHNAISTRVRDELSAALAIAVADDSIQVVVLRGNGPSFSSGGDLDEFGSRPDVAIAHVTRLARSPAHLVHRVADRVTAKIHGATLGGGIEIAAFAGRVEADESTRIGLPEIGLGLIPGAGGTVSLSRRIGRQRTAALALSGRRVGADTALAWGLVDAVVSNHDSA